MLRRYLRRTVADLWAIALVALLAGCWAPVNPALFLVPAVVGIGCVALALCYTIWPASHAMLLSLAVHGRVEQVLDAIDAELADVNRVRVLSRLQSSDSLASHLETGSILVTASWVIRKKRWGRGLVLVPLPLVVSAVRQTAPVEGVRVRLDNGRSILVPAQASLADWLLLEIRARMPEVAGAVARKWDPTVPRRLSVPLTPTDAIAPAEDGVTET
jgi:hypothetical protein